MTTPLLKPENTRATANQPAPTWVIRPGHTYGSVTDKISRMVLMRRTPRWWLIGFAVSFALLMLLLVAVTYLLLRRTPPL